MRVFAISDLHVDYPENMSWVRRLSRAEYREDVLILAGDVSDLPWRLEEVFRELAARFAKVVFVPGNHELWVTRCGTATSLQKFRLIRVLAKDCGIETSAFHRDGISIVPLLGWYDYSFGAPGDELREAWMDYHACVWPAGFDEARITRHFLALNAPLPVELEDVVISFSHFLPRLELMPGYIPPAKRHLYPVLGTALLAEQIRELRSASHLYGHSHVNQSVRIGGTLYINNALGYPSEAYMTRRELRCIYDRGAAAAARFPGWTRTSA